MIRAPAVWIGLLLVLSHPESRGAETGLPQFVDVSQEAGVTATVVSGTPQKTHIVSTTTGGAAVFDHDGDGDVDLFFVNGSRLQGFPAGEEPRAALYRNDRDWRFQDVTATTGAGHVGWGMGVAAADYDADGHIDLHLANYGPNALYRNSGDSGFANRAAAAGVDHAGWGSAAAFGDYDGDGDLDFYLTNYIEYDPEYVPDEEFCSWRGLSDLFCGPVGLPGARDVLFRNDGPDSSWKFSDASAAFGLEEYQYYSLGALASDYDGDGDLDLYIANDSTPNVLYLNEGGQFHDIAVEAGVAFEANGRAQSGMGIASGDPDGDGDLDLFVTNFSHDHNVHYRNDGKAQFADASWGLGFGMSSLAYLGWGAGFFDADHDGDEDLFVANGHVYPQVAERDMGTGYRQRNQLYENTGTGRFIDVSIAAGPGLQVEGLSRGSAFGDFDEDGDLDIVVVNLDAAPTLLRNDGGNRRNWLLVKLRGNGFNTQAIGARVTATAGERLLLREVRAGCSYLSQDDTRLHFGLGEARHVERLVVRWPDGTEQEFRDVAANQVLQLDRDARP